MALAAGAGAAAGDRHHEPPREELAFSCDIPALGLSLIDSVPCELLRLTIESVGVDYVKKPAIEQEQSLDFSVGRVQLDNQRMHAAFPVVLTPSKVDPWHRKSDEDEGKTMAVRFTLNESMPNMTVFYQPEIYLAPLSLQIEEALFRAIQGMLKSVGVLEEDTGEEKALKEENRTRTGVGVPTAITNPKTMAKKSAKERAKLKKLRML